jgi:hypothetical protein
MTDLSYMNNEYIGYIIYIYRLQIINLLLIYIDALLPNCGSGNAHTQILIIMIFM